MAYVSPHSNVLIEQERAKFVSNFKSIIISDTVEKIIASSLPIKEENGKSEIIDDAHVNELNNLISKSAKDLTDEAIKGKMIKTQFGDSEVPTNFLDAVAQSAEAYVEKESIQRANWFKIQIENGKIKDSAEDFNVFDTKLKLTFQKLNFSVEDYKIMHEEQLEIARSFEEEEIINTIKEEVINEINESETRQNKIVEIMQEVQDTKKEYEEELEEKTNGTDDIDIQPISDEETVPESEGNSEEDIMPKRKDNDADKLAKKFKQQSTEDVNQNDNEAKSQNTPAENAGNGAEGAGSMSTYQNIDNFPTQSNEIGIGDGGYSGPSVDDLGTGVLEADESNLVKKEEESIASSEDLDTENKTEDETSEDGETKPDVDPSNPKPAEDTTGETVNQVPNLDADAENKTVNEDGNIVEYTENAEKIDATIEVDPVLGAEEKVEDDPAKSQTPKESLEEYTKRLQSYDAKLEKIASKLMPLSLIKLETLPAFSKEELTKLWVKLNPKNREKLRNKVDLRLLQVSDLLSQESVDVSKIKDKVNKFKDTYRKSIEDAQYYDMLFVKVGVEPNRLTSESLFSMAVAKNFLNRSSRKKDKKIKFSRLSDPKDYGKSMENLVDYMFAITALKRKAQTSNDIQQSLEEIAQHEEKINGAIYELNDTDKDQANSLRTLLGIKNIDHYYVYDNLLLDFNNNLTRVSEDQEETPVNVISSGLFVNQVLEKLEKKGFERNASLEKLVVHLVKGDVDPALINPTIYEKICLAYGKKQLQMSKEGIDNDIENSKLATKAKVLLTIRRTAEALNIANQEFIDSFNNQFDFVI